MLLRILGLASRSCDGNPAMWRDPNVEKCSTVDIVHIREEVYNLNSTSNLTLPIQIITEELATATEKNTTSTFPNDLQSVINITRDIIRLICEGLAIHTYLLARPYQLTQVKVSNILTINVR